MQNSVISDDVKKSIEYIDYINNLTTNDLIEKENVISTLIALLGSAHHLDLNIYTEKKFEAKLAKILAELYKLPFKNDKKCIKIDTNYIGTFDRDDRIIILIYLCLGIVNIVSLRSCDFIINFCQTGLKTCFNYLKHDIKFPNLFIKVDGVDTEETLISSLIVNIYNFSQRYSELVNKWSELDAVETLLKTSKLQLNSRILCYLSITNIISDKQIEILTEVNQIIEQIQLKMIEITKNFRAKNFTREVRNVFDDDRMKDVDIHCVLEGTSTVPVTFYLYGLYQLSVNDKVRSDIYFKNEFDQSLKAVLSNGNDFESKSALKLYGQLSFNQNIASKIKKDEDLIEHLTNLKQSKNIFIVKLSEQVLWNIGQDKQASDIKPGEHIMISYDLASRDLCLKIKSLLETKGYKVWMDVEKIKWSSLDAMAKAVEDAFCVLMCVTEKYRTSINCQAEAMYAFRLNKPIIPLIMQKGYENVQGWLGIILGDKKFVNFTKHEFDECIKRLKHEIKIVKKVEFKEPQVSEIKEIPENWDENKVKIWFETNKLNISIFKELNPCDGMVLTQLYEMRRDAPEFFYQSMKSFKDVDMRSVLSFTNFLKKLFEK